MALDPDTARFFGWTMEQARAQPDSHYEAGIRRFAREWSQGTRFSLTTRRCSDGEPVGSVELRPRPKGYGEADVSYMVAAELRGQVLACGCRKLDFMFSRCGRLTPWADR
jgi:hypothetical protein